MKKIKLITLIAASLFSLNGANANEGVGFTMTSNVTYGQGKVVKNGVTSDRDLSMNVFEPTNDSSRKDTAIVMTFGGALHQGSPSLSFNIDGAQDTSMNDYCRKFARQGYFCFAIDYRLAPENPLPTGVGYTQDDLDLDSITAMSQQINIIRNKLGYTPINFDNPNEKRLIDNATLSAAEDLYSAVEYIKQNASKYGFEQSKVVLGGFSAGAVTSLNVAHGMDAEIAGVFLLSGGVSGFDIIKNTTNKESVSPVLLFQGQNDLPAMFDINPPLLAHYESQGIDYEFAWVPSYAHFYPAEAVSLSGDGVRLSIENRIMNFISSIDQK